ncbi:hypothetical protein CDL15_Pgr014598 [Punica granatum]|uniref:Uncharacterized protein n=1 Tax=Punica granatum TaxID=22663 RepID=A0A218XZ21_PUNGR|nr:hypothetical protein CDL15_Pgr014598 [Punica granatum]PKI58427.1 hypothetical protein CRG98_021185 [Punica granatum]
MFYLASGYGERVGEGFECWVTRWNPRKDVRVQGQHVRMSWDVRLDVHGHAQAWQRAQARGGARGCRQACAGDEHERKLMNVGLTLDVDVHARVCMHGETSKAHGQAHERAW